MSELVEQWLDRLGDEIAVVLDDEGLARFPELREALIPPGLSLRCESDEPHYLAGVGAEDLEVSVRGGLRREGYNSGALEIAIETRNAVMFLETFDLPHQLQQQRIGRVAVLKLAELGEELGLDSIEIQAGKIGRWAWMRCGFDFADDDAREILVSSAEAFAATMRIEVDLSFVEHSWDFLDLRGRVTAAQVAAAGGAISASDATMSLGKALVLGPHPTINPWFGSLNLDPKSPGCVRLDDYVLGQ